MYTVEHLTLPEVRDIYARCMTRDFPRNELRPLSAIEHALRRGEYLCFGLKESGQVLAYAFFVCPGCQEKKQYLFDYLAVSDHLRGNSIGSRLLEALTSGPLKDAGCILLEVDDPSKARKKDTFTSDCSESFKKESDSPLITYYLSRLFSSRRKSMMLILRIPFSSAQLFP